MRRALFERLPPRPSVLVGAVHLAQEDVLRDILAGFAVRGEPEGATGNPTVGTVTHFVADPTHLDELGCALGLAAAVAAVVLRRMRRLVRDGKPSSRYRALRLIEILLLTGCIDVVFPTRPDRAGIGFSPGGLGFDWRAIERAMLATDPPAEFGRVEDILQFVKGQTPKNASPAG